MTFFSNTRKIQAGIYIFSCLLYGFIHLTVLSFLVQSDFTILITDTMIHTFLLAILGIVLWNVFYYGKYDRLKHPQAILNYTLLAIMGCIIFAGGGYGLESLFLEKEIISSLSLTLPMKIWIFSLYYLILVLYSRNQMFNTESTAENTEITDQNNLSPQQQSTRETDPDIEYLERISVKVRQNLVVIPVEEIIYLRADGDYVKIFTGKDCYLKEQTMKYFETYLSGKQFVRIHRSYIVNIDYILRIEQFEKQSQHVTLKNGDILKVSNAGYKSLRLTLGI